MIQALELHAWYTTTGPWPLQIRNQSSRGHGQRTTPLVTFLITFESLLTSGVVWYGMVWYGMVWCGVVWCGVV